MNSRYKLNGISIKIFQWALLFFSVWHYSESHAQDSSTLPKTGNFSLPGSQQPGSFISIGQNILEKTQSQVNAFLDDHVVQNGYFIDAIPNYIYGISDRCSLQLNIPFTPRYEENGSHSSGFEDVNLQLEYAYYVKQTNTYTEQASILGSILFPTGSIEKMPPTGFGALTALLGATYIRLYENWYGFISPGMYISAKTSQIENGNIYLYQGGFGRNIISKPKKWLTAWLIEIDGMYSDYDKQNGYINENSGGNTVLVTPSLWYSTPHFSLQAGVGKNVYQKLHGQQNKSEIFYALNMAYTFT